MGKVLLAHDRGEIEALALDDGEYSPEVRCIAAPVRDYTRRVVGAISLSGPVARLTDARLEADLLPRLAAAAASLSQRLGCAAGEEGSKGA